MGRQQPPRACAGPWLLALPLLLVGATLVQAQAQAQPPGIPYPSPDAKGYLFIDCGENETAVGPGSYVVPGTEQAYTVTPVDYSDVGLISEGYSNLTEAERSLRVFPKDQPGCYWLPAGPGMWSVRLGFAYYNHDGNATAPSFTVSIGSVLTDHIHLAAWESPGDLDPAASAPGGEPPGRAHYTEYVRDLSESSSTLMVCLDSTDGVTAPVLSTLELVPYDPAVLPTITDLYLPETVPWTLALKHRIKLGGGAPVGPELDPLRRRWQAGDAGSLLYVMGQEGSYVPLYANVTVPVQDHSLRVQSFLPGNDEPNLPLSVYSTAVQGSNISAASSSSDNSNSNSNSTDGSTSSVKQLLGVRMVYRPLNPLHFLFARLFFIEPNLNVTSGQRVFNITFAATLPQGDSNSSTASEDDGSNEATVFLRQHWSPEAVSYSFDAYGAVSNYSTQTPDQRLMPLVGTYVPQVGCHPVPRGPEEPAVLYLLLQGAAGSLPPVISGLELFEIVASDSILAPCLPISEQTSADPSSVTFTDPGASSPARLSMWAVAGISMAVATAVALLVALGVVLCRRARESKEATKFHRYEASDSGLQWNGQSSRRYVNQAEVDPL